MQPTIATFVMRYKIFTFFFIDLENRFSRQGVEQGNEVPDLGEVAQAGERCVEKVMMIEETTYDDQIVCHHSYSTKCHITYITDYEAVQVLLFLFSSFPDKIRVMFFLH